MGKVAFTVLFALLLSGTVLGQQAERDTMEQTDSTRVHPLQGLRPLDLTTEEDVFTATGVAKKPKANQYYFRVAGEEEYTKVSFFGDNLAQYLEPVPKAYSVMNNFMYLRLGHVVLFYGGLGIVLAGTVVSISDKELSPLLLGGAAVFSLSWLPYFMSHDNVPEAIGAYNARLAEFNEKNR